MKKYTQEEFEGFDIVDGFKLCPKGDYTEIKEFGNDCKFSNFCEFGGDCEFGDGCEFGDDCKFGECCNYGDNCNYEDGAIVNGRFIHFGNIGTNNEETYLYIDGNKKLFLRAGCFFGDLNEFKEYCEVEKVSNKIIKQYLLLFKTGKEYFEIND